MTTYAIIENEKVINVCVAEISDIKPSNWILCESVGIGWDYVNGEFIDNRPKPLEIFTPHAPTKEQLLEQLNVLAAKIQALE
jgi:hypothetical protein